MNTHTHTKAHGRPHTYTHRTTHVKLLLTGPCCCGRSPADCGWDPATSSCCCTSHGPHLEKICEQSGGSRSVVLNAVPIHAQFSAPINHTHTHTHTSSHETRGNQCVVLPPAKPPELCCCCSDLLQFSPSRLLSEGVARCAIRPH